MSSQPPGFERTTSLDGWLAAHGPIWPADALILALHLCAKASAMSMPTLRDVIGSLNAAHIVRTTHGGGWAWRPAVNDTPIASAADADVIERVGVVLFQCLTTETPRYHLPGDGALRARLRTARPDVPAPVVDLLVTAITARDGPGITIAAFARRLQQPLGLEAAMPRPSRPRGMLVAGAVIVLALIAVGWTRTFSAERPLPHALTTRETATLDVMEETAQTLATMDEHTAAIQFYQDIGRLWSSRVALDDPRIGWNASHEAWVRTLRGDRLTTEQNLADAPTRFGAVLGDRHPYTRAVRLELAATVAARGAAAAAAALRKDAAQHAQDLLGDATVLLDGVPAPPGVVAHMAPSLPESEGFRRAGNNRFYAPLTSMQRLNSGRDGWRLHLIAAGPCRASVVVGDVPRAISVTAARRADKTWRLRVDGIAPPLEWSAEGSDRTRISLMADAHGTITATPGGVPDRSAVDTAAPPPDPPYTLAFDGGSDGTGCALVWLEIPFPFEPK
jgi:hypothetical protein